MDSVLPEWRAVSFDHTRFFNIQEEDKPFIEKILGVYFYDATERTFCCEITPSRFLHFLYYTVHMVLDTPEEVANRISERYEFERDEEGGFYMHCSAADSLPFIPYGEADEDTNEEVVREHWQSNYPI